MYRSYGVLLVPLCIFEPPLCLSARMLQRSILSPIGIVPNTFSLILGIHIVTFCYFFLLYIARFLISIDMAELKSAYVHDLDSHFRWLYRYNWQSKPPVLPLYTPFSNITVQHSVSILRTEYYVVLYVVYTMWASSVCHASHGTEVFA